MAGRERVVHVRVSEAGLALFEAKAAERGVKRSEAYRAAMTDWMGDAASPAPSVVSQPAGHRLSDEEWKTWLWLNTLAEKSYLGGEPIQLGMNLDGIRFSLDIAEDPNRNIA